DTIIQRKLSRPQKSRNRSLGMIATSVIAITTVAATCRVRMAASWAENEGNKPPAAGNRRYARECSEKDMIHTRETAPRRSHGCDGGSPSSFFCNKSVMASSASVAARVGGAE